MMKPLLESLRRARHIEWFALIAVAALVCGLWLNADIGTRDAERAEKTALELRLESLLSHIEGSGKVSVMITTKEDGTAEGAVVVVDAHGSIRAMLEMQSAVQTLLNIELSRIRIIDVSAGEGRSS